jgi:hypothetical protein
MKRVVLIFSIVFHTIWYGAGQSSYRIGVLPQVNVNIKLADEWRLVARAETRQQLATGIYGDPFGISYKNSLTDLAILLSKRIAGSSSLTGGYQLRLSDQQYIHRIIQQYSLISQHRSFRLSHRFAADQSFSVDEPEEFRFRYRIGFEKALQGQNIDPGEFYFKLNQEQLLSFNQERVDLELRLFPSAGFSITDNNKIEIGIDSRFNSFINNNLRSSYWLGIGWFITI